MIGIAMNGAAGRMGQRITAQIEENRECQLVCALESADHPLLGEDAGEIAGGQSVGVTLQTELTGSPDILIDFSAPGACIERAKECAEAKIGMVIGTTGFNSSQKKTLEEDISDQIPILIAPNMGLGVNLLFQLAGQVADALGEEYDVEIIETHHRRKKDAPSGTAGKLAEEVCSALNWAPEEVIKNGREGFTGERSHNELAIHAVRGGSVVGDHTVVFAGEGERIELTHKAQSRDLFAKGAIHAAIFLKDQKPGNYTMKNVLF